MKPVVVDGVSKTFRIPHEQVHTLKERVLHPMRGRTYDRFEALRDVSFEVQPGEFFGIVGRNGSGKSTLLKCLAGIYRPDSGAIYMSGRVSTFIELGVGFNPDLAARDNVVLNALMLGLSPRQARDRVDRVIEFAELEQFADLKLKNYSSGMHVRLAFSVMIQVDADVLLIDEVLAVGDAAFQQKCFDEFHRLRDEGRTLLLVTHDMSAVARFCDRALLLERGDPVATGPPDEIAEQYLAMNFARYEATRTKVDEGPIAPGKLASIREVWFEDEYGQVAEFHAQGRRTIFKARVEVREDVDELGFWLAIDNDNGLRAFTTSTSDEHRRGFHAGEIAVLTLDFQNDLMPGWRYHVSLELEWGGERRKIERRERIASIVVTGARLTLDDQTLEHELSVEAEQERVG
ncbi:MAG TPA: ABC transporter ATP-binding protein [Thermoleophilaceae bacterium]|jgi:ABC-type polysaccharide/polyol phosphate transport system ATPase subunit|nr:ABC transporter ATP-binding protein [Thermoleophilaceae bacterium]